MHNTTTHNTPEPLDQASIAESARSVLEFWLGDGLHQAWPSEDRSALWFRGGPTLDAEISSRFGSWVQRAVDGGLRDWEANPLHRVALIILLDQFTRNVFRGQAAAFAGDARAQTLSLATLAMGQDQALPAVAQVFVLMPLMHAEDRLLQAACEQRFRDLQARSDATVAAQIQNNVNAAVQHRAIIERFGRFPHRNAALGRSSSAQELAFLTDGPRFGQ